MAEASRAASEVAWHPDSLTPAGPAVAAATPEGRWTGHGLERLRPVQLSRGGTRVVCWDDEKKLSVWDLTSGWRVFGPAHHPDPGRVIFGEPSRAGWVSDAVLSPDGRWMAVGIESTGTLTVWDVDGGRIVHHHKWFRGFIYMLAFSDDGRRILVLTSDTLVRVYDADTGIPVGPAVHLQMFLRSVGVSLDGRRLVVYVPTLKAFRLVETERGERLLTIPLGDGNIPLGDWNWPTALWFDASGGAVNAIINGNTLTFPLPKFDASYGDSASLMRFLTGQQIDDTDGIEFVDQFTFKKNPDHYRDVFRAWKGLPVDGR